MIEHVDWGLAKAVQDKIDNLSKPKGSLGRLEELALQVALVQQTLTPQLIHPCHILFGGDHGIEREGVTCTPREVTAQQMMNYGRGGGAVGMFCRQHQVALRVVDVGVDAWFDPMAHPNIIHRKIARGTKNFLYEPAMSAGEWEEALRVGAEMVDRVGEEGCNILSLGEMGAGNTSPSSVLMHLLQGFPLAECVGAGSGLGEEGVRHKLDVLAAAVENYRRSRERAASSSRSTLSPAHPPVSREETEELVRYFAGFEMAAAIGAMLRAAERRMVVLVDGFIMTACMLAASRLDEAVTDYAVFTHQGDEGGHKRMLAAMGAKPLLNLGLRLGEGTGALCAFPLVDSAVRMLNDMDNFENAHITKYF